MERSAILSGDGLYRYALHRRWCPRPPRHVLFVGLNPSTADAEVDDRTLMRCVGFARSWGYGAVAMANLYAWRATKPAALKSVADPVGPDFDRHFAELVDGAALIVAAWGAWPGPHEHRVASILAGPLHGRELFSVGTTKSGQPRHPLYVPGNTDPQRWQP